MSVTTERKMESALLEALEGLAEFVKSDDDIELATEESGVSRVHTFEDDGILTNNRGLVVRLANGAEFQVTIVQSHTAEFVKSHDECDTALDDGECSMCDVERNDGDES